MTAGPPARRRFVSVLTALSAGWVIAPAAGAESALLTSDRPAVVEMRTAALIMSGQEGGALPIEIAALADGEACGGDAGDCRFTALVEIDGAALLDGGPGTVEVFVYVLGPELDVLALETLSLDLAPSDHRQPLETTGLKVLLPFKTAPGVHQLRVLAQAGEAFGVRGLELSAGPPPGEAPPGEQRISHQQAPWLLAIPAGVEIPLPPPFSLEDGAPLPATREHELLAVGDRSPDVAAGDALSAISRRPVGHRRLARAAKTEYTQALRHLAAGERDAAASTLMAGEQRVFEALGADAVELLAQAASRVLARIPDADWECVLPVVLLHLDASRVYRDRGRRLLAVHATRMTVDLAGAYASKLAQPRARSEAASALASLGGDMLQENAWGHAERLFRSALELAEDHAAALFGLAAQYEKRGLFERAVPALERFHAVHPEHAEGTLRLGLNHARTGRAAAARATLSELADRREGDWITVLAHQELARLAIDAEEPSAAETILRRGLVRWPDHPTLQLLLAWVLEVQGDAGASLELLESLGVSGASAAATPAAERSRYNRWAVDFFADHRRALDEAAAARAPALARWLPDQADEG